MPLLLCRSQPLLRPVLHLEQHNPPTGTHKQIRHASALLEMLHKVPRSAQGIDDVALVCVSLHAFTAS
jgi:hypothetical protein